MTKPKILIWDLETGGINGFKADLARVYNFGYKWLGEPRVTVLTVDQYRGWFSKGQGVSDLGILKAALPIMEQADLMVAHFGDKFDRRFFNGRCIINDLPPPPTITKQRDTWRIAKTAFAFSSNRLGSLAMTLGLPEQKHQKTRDEWPGWWIRAAAGDHTAIRDMAKYCAQDVRTLEQVYLKIRSYDNPHPNMHPDREVCFACGGPVQYRGFMMTGKYRYRRYQCQQCGKWGRDSKRVSLVEEQ